MEPISAEDLWRILEEGASQPVREAERALERLTAALPDQRDGHYHLARAHRLLRRPGRAREELRRALEIDPEFVFAEVLLREIDAEDAHLEGSVSAEPDPPYPGKSADWKDLWLASRAATRDKNWPAVIAAYDQLIFQSQQKGEPYIGFFIEAYMKRGTASLELEHFEEALRDFAVVQHLAPGSLEATLLSAKVEELGCESYPPCE